MHRALIGCRHPVAARTLRLLPLLLLLFCAPLLRAADADAEESPQLAGRVLRVIDGDTLDVRLSSGRIRVRLHGIDAPEKNQPGGEESSRWLRAVLQDADVLLEPVSQDRYERMVALVHLEGVNVNIELLRAGHAWAYRSYLRRADRHWCDLEHAARAAKQGLWSARAPHAPWEFRSTRGKGPFTAFGSSTATDCRRAAGR